MEQNLIRLMDYLIINGLHNQVVVFELLDVTQVPSQYQYDTPKSIAITASHDFYLEYWLAETVKVKYIGCYMSLLKN